ncbi:NUDIX hydrolase [Saccharothrix sp. ST-888]|uniref:NUDIX hydrolase n=1 Tax=Saccharothrix sp. ST-888 TaxID=1427391 RepID=UPI0005EC935F|nr:NUDIX domain-containing protein [Saccharothrix sp. ST-888]KJK55863.1 NUDIX hydrolase [Saccharothrix sp. ST-888]
MSRKDYFDDPNAPKAQRIVPAVTAFVVNDHGDLLLERRSDNGKWGMPGGTLEIGENLASAVVREVREETGIDVDVVGLVGTYSNPGHVIEFSDGEVRQEFSLCFRARPTGGILRASSESFEVRWVPRGELDALDIAPTTRLRLDHGFRAEADPFIG